MKKSLLTVSAYALMLMPSLVAAQTMSAQMPVSVANSVSSTDKDFVHDAAIGGMTEVKISRLALKKTTNQDVKNFAQQMVDDHGKANKQLKTIAKKIDVSVPASLDAEHQGAYDSLKKLSGAEFDQHFIQVMDKDHNAAVNAFQKEADAGTNPQLKTFAGQTLPTLQHHLEDVKGLESKYPSSTSTSQ